MADQIKMNFAMMEEMAQTFRKSAQVLEDVNNEVIQMTQAIEKGALLGEAGEALQNALRGPLCSAITRLQGKFEEMETDIRAAADAMKQAEKSAGALYT